MLTNEGGEQKVGAAGGVAGDQVRVSVVADPESAAESLSDLKARNVALTQKLAEFKARVRTLQAQVEEMEVKDEQVIEALREAKDLLVELEQVIEARKDRAGGENVAAADKGALRKLPTDGNEHKTEAAGAATGNTISILVKMMVRATKQLPLVLLLPVDTMHRKLTDVRRNRCSRPTQDKSRHLHKTKAYRSPSTLHHGPRPPSPSS